MKRRDFFKTLGLFGVGYVTAALVKCENDARKPAPKPAAVVAPPGQLVFFSTPGGNDRWMRDFWAAENLMYWSRENPLLKLTE